MRLDYFSQRLLNPFRGTLQVVRYGPAEAVSQDGVEWDIYVANDSLLEGLDGATPAQVSDIRYGHWSAARGLKRGPLYPSADFRRMEALGAVVYEHLRRLQATVPFPLGDLDEYWLLDQSGRPLALLHSARDAREAGNPPAPVWHAGLAAQARFRSPGYDAPASHLEAWVRVRAGATPRAAWFRRQADGSGQPLEAEGAPLSASAFPPLCLAADDASAPEAALLAEYHAWQAAWLLCLPTLDRATRRHLEAHARQQPDLVESLHRLYPEILDSACLNAARVEARLLGSQAVQAAAVPDAASTFYIELNPQGGGYT